MAGKDPISSRFEIKEKQQKLDELAKKARTRTDIEDEEALLKKTAKAETIHAKQVPDRNDQCPCGSGKKYKKCCADKDQQ